MNDIFKFITPFIYLLLIITWLSILVIFLRRIFSKKYSSNSLKTLIIILAITAFSILFESIYFGAWYTSAVGFLPKVVHVFLVAPENVILPKIINLITAVLVIFILIKTLVSYRRSRKNKTNCIY
jgi:hypothetical protein